MWRRPRGAGTASAWLVTAMADPLSALLAEQARLQPMLERLLQLAALWADPVARPAGEGDAAVAEPGAESADAATSRAMALGAAGIAASPPPADELAHATGVAPSVATGLPTADRAIASPEIREAVPSGARQMGGLAASVVAAQLSTGRGPTQGGARAAAGPFAAAMRMAQHLSPSPLTGSRGLAPLGLQPGGSDRLPGWDSAGEAATRLGVPATASSVDDEPGGLARLGMVLAAAASGGVAGPAPGGRGMAGGAMALSAPLGRGGDAPVGAVSAWRGGVGEPGPGVGAGDALEERLADILERAAAEAGVLLP